MSFAIVGGALITIAGGLFSSGAAKKRARKAKIEADNQARILRGLEASRQAIINPFSGVRDLSSMAKDLSNMVSNPFASLGVATGAAEIKIEEADIALANTLDTLRATGASAGGATALAQAALKSKKGVAASIEAQEAQNEKLKAQGEQKMEMLQMQEAARIQGVQISEGQRVQGAQAQGKAFMFQTREQREMQKMNRVAGLGDRAMAQQMQARADSSAALTGMIGGLGSIASAGISAGATKKAGLLSNPNLGVDELTKMGLIKS